MAFAASLLFKETAVALPAIILAYEAIVVAAPRSQRISVSVKRSVAYWAALLVYLIARWQVLGFVAMRQRNWDLDPLSFALTELHLVASYWYSLILPIRLNAYHVFAPMHSLADLRLLAAVLVLVVLMVGSVAALRRDRLITFCVAWVLLTLAPALNIYATGRNVFAERYLYLPSVGFCLLTVLLVTAVATRIPERIRKTALALLLVIAAVIGVIEIYSRNPAWKDNKTLFTQTLTESPDAPFVHFMVAESQSDDPFAAENHYVKAVSLARSESPPDLGTQAMSGEGLASLYAERGNFDQALKALSEVRAANPNDPEIDGEAGLILTQAGRYQEAEAALRKAVAQGHANENVLNALGMLEWHGKQDPRGAASYFSSALEVHTAQDAFAAALHSNLGAVYGEVGQMVKAIAEFRSAVSIDPSNPQYRTNLAIALMAIGNLSAARAELDTIFRMTPDYPPARLALQRLKSLGGGSLR
jgi:Flp pilus assembly protein TadD